MHIFSFAVGCWIRNLLVPRWFKKQQILPSSLACILGGLHIRPCCCNLCYWDTRESNISSDQPDHITLLFRGIISEFIGCLVNCFGRFCYSCYYFSWKWQRRNSQRFHRIGCRRKLDVMVAKDSALSNSGLWVQVSTSIAIIVTEIYWTIFLVF